MLNCVGERAVVDAMAISALASLLSVAGESVDVSGRRKGWLIGRGMRRFFAFAPVGLAFATAFAACVQSAFPAQRRKGAASDRSGFRIELCSPGRGWLEGSMRGLIGVGVLSALAITA